MLSPSLASSSALRRTSEGSSSGPVDISDRFYKPHEQFDIFYVILGCVERKRERDRQRGRENIFDCYGILFYFLLSPDYCKARMKQLLKSLVFIWTFASCSDRSVGLMCGRWYPQHLPPAPHLGGINLDAVCRTSIVKISASQRFFIQRKYQKVNLHGDLW